MPDKVYVISRFGHPLMPCSPAKARHLLDAGKARVIKRTPFTIRLLYGSTEYTQPVILGVDAGSKTIGLSASTVKEELLAAEVMSRNDVVENLSTRREFRKTRRSRTTRYRKPRFNNRIHSKNKGWLAPSVEVKIQEHITSIKKVCAILPVSKVVVETVEFNLQLLKAVQDGKPAPEGEDYQRGEMYGSYNVRQYVLWRDNYTCICCGARGTPKAPVRLHVHHFESRKHGGNAPDNQGTLCDDCHKKFHLGIITDVRLKMRRRQSTRDAAFMGIMRRTLMLRLKAELSIPVVETKGYITKATRVEFLRLPKTHTSDALAIAQGKHGFCILGQACVELANHVYTIHPVRHHNRQIHKASIMKGGIRKRNQASKYVFGFRLYDKVLYQGKECFVWGRRTSGSFLLRTIDGIKVKDGVRYRNLTLLERSSNYLIA